jgi:hypothetical protein
MLCPHVNLVKSMTVGYECTRCGAEFSVEPRDVVARGMPVLTTERARSCWPRSAACPGSSDATLGTTHLIEVKGCRAAY